MNQINIMNEKHQTQAAEQNKNERNKHYIKRKSVNKTNQN